MIGTMLRIGWLNLKRDGLALALTFVVPIALFSVFALVFGSMDDGARRPVKVAFLREEAVDGTDALLERLRAIETLRVTELPIGASPSVAEERVRMGQVALALVVPAGFGRPDGKAGPIRMLADTSNPIALEVVRGAVQAALAPPAPPAPEARAQAPPPPSGTQAPAAPARVLEIVDLLGNDGRKPSISFFAAGLGVMFLLFAVSGRGALLIEERERGVLVRMLTSQLGLARLLFGRWLHLLILGALQVTGMFVWGALVFGLDLFTPRHLAGFAAMTITTAAAAAAFALLLAVLCRTRAQLSGITVVLVLIMSALGGSMFPRFLMPESLQQLGRLTFNAWALDGYRKVFWYEAAPIELAPELGVLGGVTLVFFAGAALFARRWQRA